MTKTENHQAVYYMPNLIKGVSNCQIKKDYSQPLHNATYMFISAFISTTTHSPTPHSLLYDSDGAIKVTLCESIIISPPHDFSCISFPSFLAFIINH